VTKISHATNITKIFIDSITNSRLCTLTTHERLLVKFYLTIFPLFVELASGSLGACLRNVEATGILRRSAVVKVPCTSAMTNVSTGSACLSDRHARDLNRNG